MAPAAASKPLAASATASKPSVAVPRTRSRTFAARGTVPPPSTVDFPTLIEQLKAVVDGLGELDIGPSIVSKSIPVKIDHTEEPSYCALNPDVGAAVDDVIGRLQWLCSLEPSPNGDASREYCNFHDQLVRARGALIRARVGEGAVDDEFRMTLDNLRDCRVDRYQAIRDLVVGLDAIDNFDGSAHGGTFVVGGLK